MGIVLFWAFHLCFSTFIGGYFLWTVCQIYEEWERKSSRARHGTGKTELKTTDAGPYTAPGVPTDPSEDGPAKPVAERGIEAPPAYWMACLINFVVYWSVLIANYFLAFYLYVASSGEGIGHLFWLSPLLSFSIALFSNTVLLQTTQRRGFMITLMLVVPWTAAAIAFMGICMLR